MGMVWVRLGMGFLPKFRVQLIWSVLLFRWILARIYLIFQWVSREFGVVSKLWQGWLRLPFPACRRLNLLTRMNYARGVMHLWPILASNEEVLLIVAVWPSVIWTVFDGPWLGVLLYLQDLHTVFALGEYNMDVTNPDGNSNLTAGVGIFSRRFNQ